MFEKKAILTMGSNGTSGLVTKVAKKCNFGAQYALIPSLKNARRPLSLGVRQYEKPLTREKANPLTWGKRISALANKRKVKTTTRFVILMLHYK